MWGGTDRANRARLGRAISWAVGRGADVAMMGPTWI